jgi:hypothetical protein
LAVRPTKTLITPRRVDAFGKRIARSRHRRPTKSTAQIQIFSFFLIDSYFSAPCRETNPQKRKFLRNPPPAIRRSFGNRVFFAAYCRDQTLRLRLIIYGMVKRN